LDFKSLILKTCLENLLFENSRKGKKNYFNFCPYKTKKLKASRSYGMLIILGKEKEQLYFCAKFLKFILSRITSGASHN